MFPICVRFVYDLFVYGRLTMSCKVRSSFCFDAVHAAEAADLQFKAAVEESVGVLLPGRLGFVSGAASKFAILKDWFAGTSTRLVTTNLHLQYHSFADDFGPVNLGVVYRFCSAFSKKLARDETTAFIYCIEETFQAQANASFLLGAFW